MSEVKTLAVLVLGGIFDHRELGDIDMLYEAPACEALQRELVNSTDDVHVELISRIDYDAAQSELTALREELARLKDVTNFKDAVACVFDNLKYAACNTSDRTWDDQLEDLADDVIEFAPEYKKQWKDIGALSAKLTAAEQRSTTLEADKARIDFWESQPSYAGGFAPSGDWSFFGRNGETCYGKTLRSALDQLQVMHADLTKPTESGASE